jgi:hypothetical protein
MVYTANQQAHRYPDVVQMILQRLGLLRFGHAPKGVDRAIDICGLPGGVLPDYSRSHPGGVTGVLDDLLAHVVPELPFVYRELGDEAAEPERLFHSRRCSTLGRPTTDRQDTADHLRIRNGEPHGDRRPRRIGDEQGIADAEFLQGLFDPLGLGGERVVGLGRV